MGTIPKQLHHIFRLEEFIIRYFYLGESFEKCLISNKKEFLIAMKDCTNGVYYSLEEAREKAEAVINTTKLFKEGFKRQFNNYIDTEVEDLIDKVDYEILKKRIITEIQE